MEISEQDLRTMIREAIARHGGGAASIPAAGPQEPAGSCAAHASHGLLAIVSTSDGDCIIEPAVRCNHCGYCKSLGH